MKTTQKLLTGALLGLAAPLALAQSNAFLEADGPLQGSPRGGATSCSVDALISQGLTDFGSANTSDVGVDLLVAENFTEIGVATTVSTGEATSVKVWGLQLELDPVDGFVGPCGINGADFTVTSWTDNGGLPGAVIDTQTITPTVVDTGIGFALGATILEAQLPVSPALDLDNAGFVSVQREASPDTMAGNQCLFLWVNNTAGVGDNNALQIDTVEETVTDTDADTSMCVEGTGSLVPPVLEPTEVAGFTFEGSVTGISGSTAWASDMRLDIVSPSSNATAVGGFENSGPLSWDFDGAGSTEDGFYTSDHSGAFLPSEPVNGTWTLAFTHDLTGTAAVQCWTGTLVTFIQNDGTQTEVAIPDQCYAGGEAQVIDVPLGQVFPETQAVPVNSFWALSLMALMLAGFGVVVIRRMA